MGLDKITKGNFKETNSVMDLGAGLIDFFCVCVSSVTSDASGSLQPHGL